MNTMITFNKKKVSVEILGIIAKLGDNEEDRNRYLMGDKIPLSMCQHSNPFEFCLKTVHPMISNHILFGVELILWDDDKSEEVARIPMSMIEYIYCNN